MARAWEGSLRRWTDAGVLEVQAAERIRSWERQQERQAPGSGAPHRMAAVSAGLGGLLLASGTMLFVSAHWDQIGPALRLLAVLGMVGLLHLGGALCASRAPRAALALHAAGTGSLGAGIFLCGQIFNLAEHWPTALLLWSLGAAAGWALLRDWPHLLWLAVLVPAWLVGEWSVAFDGATSPSPQAQVPLVGTVLLAFSYLAALGRHAAGAASRALARLGGGLLIPTCALLAAAAEWPAGAVMPATRAAMPAQVLAWAVAVGAPMALACALRGWRGCLLAVPLAWCLLLAFGPWHGAAGAALRYGLLGIGGLGVIGWGALEHETRIVNLGVWGFALTVVAFYFSSIFDRLGRSLGLIGLGLLLLGGGWLMERLRRRLVTRIAGAAS